MSYRDPICRIDADFIDPHVHGSILRMDPQIICAPVPIEVSELNVLSIAADPGGDWIAVVDGYPVLWDYPYLVTVSNDGSFFVEP